MPLRTWTMSRVFPFFLAARGAILLLLDRFPAERSFRILEHEQSRESRPDDVVRIGRPQRLGQDVLNPYRFHHRPDCAPGDDSGPGGGGPEHHLAGAEMPDDGMRNGSVLDRNPNEIALRPLHPLGDGHGNFSSLSHPEAHMA